MICTAFFGNRPHYSSVRVNAGPRDHASIRKDVGMMPEKGDRGKGDRGRFLIMAISGWIPWGRDNWLRLLQLSISRTDP